MVVVGMIFFIFYFLFFGTKQDVRRTHYDFEKNYIDFVFLPFFLDFSIVNQTKENEFLVFSTLNFP